MGGTHPRTIVSEIDAVIFDLGNVLVRVDEAKACRRFAARTGRAETDIEQYFRRTPHATQLSLGKLSGRQFHRIVADDLGFDGSFEEFALLWSDIFEPIEPMIELATTLDGRLPRAILSNTNALHIEFIFARFPVIRKFGAHILSHEVGWLKPDATIYRVALDSCGWNAERTLFVDDLPANVEGARTVGMRALQFESAEQVRRELTKLGVAPI